MKDEKSLRLTYRGHRKNFRKHLKEAREQFDLAMYHSPSGEAFSMAMSNARSHLAQAQQHFHELNACHNTLFTD